MDDRNQDTKEYTGEYGNIVEHDTRSDPVQMADGADPADVAQPGSIYRYSYRDHMPEATRSGDYFASGHERGGQDTDRPQEKAPGQTDSRSGQWHTAGETTEQESVVWQRTGTGQQPDDADDVKDAIQTVDATGSTASNGTDAGLTQDPELAVWQRSGTGQQPDDADDVKDIVQTAGNTLSNGADAGSTVGSADNDDSWQSRSSNALQPRDNSLPTEQTANKKRDRDRSDGITGKKLAMCAGMAIFFGIIASFSFQAVQYFAGRISRTAEQPDGSELSYTTDNVRYTSAATDVAIGTADVSGIVQQTMPSMVSITSTTEGQATYDLFGQYYEGQDTVSAGTGFIVGKNDTELLIATNNHVVNGAKAISVQFIDEEVYDAITKGQDSSTDLAVIAVDLKDIKSSTMESIRAASLGDSSECKVGEMVVAIGNALGYGQSVTVGYVSAKDREITAEADHGQEQGNKMKVIQTDAAINPGNSGGPLLNMQGRVIGITSAKIAASTVEGVGYSIPISEATPIIDELMNREVLTDAQKGYLGILGKTVTEEASNFDMPEGVYVDDVSENGAADKAGIRKGDIITAINDIQVTTIESLREKANSYKKGTVVTITLQRNDNGSYQEQKVDVELQGEGSLNDLDDGSSSRQQDNGNGQPDNGNGQQDNDNGQPDNGGAFGGNDSDDGWGGLFPDFGY